MTFVKILFRLARSLWTTKLSTPVTICMVKYVSTSSIALVIAVSCSKLKEYDSQWHSLLKIVGSCLRLQRYLEMTQITTCLLSFHRLWDTRDKNLDQWSIWLTSTENKFEQPLQLLWLFFSRHLYGRGPMEFLSRIWMLEELLWR